MERVPVCRPAQPRSRGAYACARRPNNSTANTAWPAHRLLQQAAATTGHVLGVYPLHARGVARQCVVCVLERVTLWAGGAAAPPLPASRDPRAQPQAAQGLWSWSCLSLHALPRAPCLLRPSLPPLPPPRRPLHAHTSRSSPTTCVPARHTNRVSGNPYCVRNSTPGTLLPACTPACHPHIASRTLLTHAAASCR